jgi:hypothetical protein
MPWWIQGMALELYHGFTTQGQPWWLGHGLSHPLGNSRTCGGRRLPPVASPSCRRLFDEWMDGCGGRWRQRQFIEERLGKRASRTTTKRGWVGRPGPTSLGPFLARFDPGSLLNASRSIVDLLPYACGPWRRLLHVLDRAPCRTSFNIFCSGPWSFMVHASVPGDIWSHVHDVPRLLSGFMIFSWIAWWTYPESLPLSASFLRKQQTPKSTWESELDTSGGLVPLVRISNTCKCWW